MAAWVVPAITAAGSLLSALGSGGGSSGGGASIQKKEPKIRSSTNAQQGSENIDILYDEAALSAMSDLADQIGQFAQQNENFIKDVYMPYQEQMTQANVQMIPQMEGIVGASLEGMTRDLMSNQVLGDILRARAEGDQDPNSFVNQTMSKLETEIQNLPTEEERVGQALASVEHQFKGAGKQLAKDFASRGQAVSQASKRDLLMGKATAKAGAAGQAAEAARGERLSMLSSGLQAGLNKRLQEEQITGAATQGLLGLQQMQQNALGAKEGLFNVDRPDATGVRGQQSALVGQLGVLQRGTTGETDSLHHRMAGVKSMPEIQPDGSIKIGSKILKSDEYKELINKYGNIQDAMTELATSGLGGGTAPYKSEPHDNTAKGVAAGRTMNAKQQSGFLGAVSAVTGISSDDLRSMAQSAGMGVTGGGSGGDAEGGRSDRGSDGGGSYGGEGGGYGW